VALVPLVGESLQRLLVGGGDYGHHTLTRFFALHAGVLPGLLTLGIVLHVALFRRHGLKAREPFRRPDATFWPDQVLRDAVACLVVMIVVLVLVLRNFSHLEGDLTAGEVLGTELSAPADPAENYSAARPENYFLFLFQTLKYLEVFPPVVGAVIVPGLVMLSLFLMPLIGRWELGHRFNVVWTFALLVGVGVLTVLAIREDRNGETEHSQHFLAAVAQAKAKAERAVALAGAPDGIPPAGALAMLHADPLLQGPKLFRQHCSACHSHAPVNGDPSDLDAIVAEEPSAPNLWNFGTPQWVAGLLDPNQIAGPNYFGNTTHKDGEMVTWVHDTLGPDATADLSAEELTQLRENLKFVTYSLAAEGGNIREQFPREWIELGRTAMIDEFACIDCHKFHDEGGLGMAPDLTGWASREWMTAIIGNPEHERFYPETNDRMPAFAAHPDDPAANRLNPEELELLVRWLRREYYVRGAANINPSGPESLQ